MDKADYPTLDPKLLENPVFQALVAEGLAIQDRFAAEPVYARTGKGYLKSVGVSEMERVKGGTQSPPRNQPNKGRRTDG
ncbi:MAG: hypothetical protein ACKO2G_16755 [Verrucomicrobiales bacterium]